MPGAAARSPAGTSHGLQSLGRVGDSIYFRVEFQLLNLQILGNFPCEIFVSKHCQTQCLVGSVFGLLVLIYIFINALGRPLFGVSRIICV